MITSTENAEHYTWGDHCDGWHLLRSDSLSVIQERMPPGAAEDLHFHHLAQQLFYILSGVATFEINGEIKTINAGQSVHIERSIKHRINNNGDADFHFLVISEAQSTRRPGKFPIIIYYNSSGFIFSTNSLANL